MQVIILGSGSPLPDPNRAGPATLVRAGDKTLLFDCGRGVLMRAAAVKAYAPRLDALFITHMHSDHTTDFNDVITTRWVMTFEPTPLTIVGPVGTKHVVDHLLASLGPDIAYRLAHHDDLDHEPPVHVIEIETGEVPLGGATTITAGQTDHKPVEPSVGYRFDSGGHSVVVAGDTVPCDSLDALCAGADALVHTAIRKDIIATVPMQRLLDTLDYHSSPEEAAATAQRAGMTTLVLTHYVPAIAPGGEQEWVNLAATEFAGQIEVGDDLHTVTIGDKERGE